MKKDLTVTQNIDAIIQDVIDTGAEHVISKDGKPVAVLVDYDELQAMRGIYEKSVKEVNTDS